MSEQILDITLVITPEELTALSLALLSKKTTLADALQLMIDQQVDSKNLSLKLHSFEQQGDKFFVKVKIDNRSWKS